MTTEQRQKNKEAAAKYFASLKTKKILLMEIQISS